MVARPGKGVQLDDELAHLLMADKRVQAMRKCNHELFSSRSPRDRETAIFWKTVLETLEDIEESHYKKASKTMKNGEKWLKSPHKKYHSRFIVQLIEKLMKQRIAVRNLKGQISDLKGLRELESENRMLSRQNDVLKRENAKLEKLMRDLENVK
jgi:hypothetical protein